jgi:hypothetical protein
MSLPELLGQLGSEFLREVLKDGRRMTYITGIIDTYNLIDPLYNDLYPAVEFYGDDCRWVFVHKGDRFMVDIVGKLSPEFSYNHTEGEMKLFFQALYGELAFDMGIDIRIGELSLVMGGITYGEISTINIARISIYNCSGSPHPREEPISEPNFETYYLYSFESVEEYVKKVELAARCVFGHVNKFDINQDHWLDFDRLMRGSMVKSARSVVE